MNETESQKQKCPHCNRLFADLDKHYKSNKKCGDMHSSETNDEKDKDVEEIVDELDMDSMEEKIDADQDNPESIVEESTVGPASQPIVPTKRSAKIKFVDELPFEKIKGLGKAADKIKAWFKDNGIVLIQQLASKKISEINIKGIGEAFAAAILNMARNALGIHFMTRASDIPIDYQIISTGVSALDKILGGGIRTGETYEFHGPYGSGKTQVALEIAVQMQLPVDKHGLYDPADGKRPQALWMDSEGTFDGIVSPDPVTSSSRLDDVSRASYMNAFPPPDDEASKPAYDAAVNEFIKNVSDNIIVCKVTSAEHQIDTVKYILARSMDFNIRVIIVDSIIAHFRSEFIGRGTLSDRQQKLNRHIHDLHILRGNDAALIVTNQVQSTPESMGKISPEFLFKATGGNIIAHALNIRVKLRKGKSDSIHAEIIDASYLPRDECNFTITSKGIESIEL